MTAVAHTTQTTFSNAKRAVVGSAWIVAAAVAVAGMILVLSSAQSSSTRFAPTVAMDTNNQSQLSGLLCRIDRRCPTVALTQAAREASRP